jgi:hypothetical protein
MREDKVFAQAERLAMPQLEKLRWQLNGAWAAANRGFGSATVFCTRDVCDDFLTKQADVLVNAVVEAHKTQRNRRNARWSEDTFAHWCGDLLRTEAEHMKSMWPGSEEWARLRREFLAVFDPIVAREFTRMDGLVRQHFRTNTKNWFQVQVERLKVVPTEVWKWILGGGAFAAVISVAKHFQLF